MRHRYTGWRGIGAVALVLLLGVTCGEAFGRERLLGWEWAGTPTHFPVIQCRQVGQLCRWRHVAQALGQQRTFLVRNLLANARYCWQLQVEDTRVFSNVLCEE